MHKRAILLTLFLAVLGSRNAAHAQSIVWGGALGGTGNEFVGHVAVDSHGNVYLAGSFSGTADLDPGDGTLIVTSAGMEDAFLAKFDPAGRLLWALQFGGPGRDFANHVITDMNGNLILAGGFQDTVDFDPGAGTLMMTSAGNFDAFVCALDSGGDFLWARHVGGPGHDSHTHLSRDSAGNLYLTGSFNGTADFDPGPGIENLVSVSPEFGDAFALKLDSDGNFLWARSAGGSSLDVGHSIIPTGDGDVYVLGRFRVWADFDPGPGTLFKISAGENDGFLWKLDSQGELVSITTFGGANEELPNALAVNGDGDAYITGWFLGTSDLDPGPGTFSVTSAGDIDAFVMKLDSEANFVWGARAGDILDDGGIDLALDPLGNLYVVGCFEGTADFDPGPGTFDLTSDGTLDSFIWKLDDAGRLLWAGRMGGSDFHCLDSIALDGFGGLHVAGGFEVAGDVDPGPGLVNVTGAGLRDVFFAKLRACDTFINRSPYGRSLFSPLCASDASGLAVDVYESTTIAISPQADGEYYLSSSGIGFAPLVIDDAIRINGIDSGLGPHLNQPGTPPFVLNTAIEHNKVPLPAHEITSLLPTDSSPMVVELLDFERVIHGNSPVYLVNDCGIYVEQTMGFTIHHVSHEVEVVGLQSDLEIVTGALSALQIDGDYTSAECLGLFIDSVQATDLRPDPPLGDGYYYLVDGTCAVNNGFGNSSILPDPRDSIAGCQ